jgi:hypothetical protein
MPYPRLIVGDSPSLFRRLRRFRATVGRDAFEDRLTEALAATLEAAPAATRELVGRWFDARPEGPLLVATQRWAGAGERIDLELAFGPLQRPELRVWFEAKVDAAPQRDQAERYLAALERLGGPGRLSWLVPVGVGVAGGSPPGAAEHNWQELATVFNDWLAELDAEEAARFGPGLVREFVRHLEEEGLASVSPLDELDAQAINRYWIALARVRELVRLAGAEIASRRGPIYKKETRNPLDFWEHAQRAEGWSDDSYFEWHGRHDEARLEPVGEWVLGAGVSWNLGNELAERDFAEWYGRRYDEGFERGVSARRVVYLFRYRTLADLARYPTLSEQAQQLANWALESWALLDADLPR